MGIYSSQALGTAADELRASMDGARSTVAARHALRDVRLVVIAGELMGDTEYSKKLATLSRRGIYQVAQGSGHSVQYERPDLVTDAIRQVIEQVRSE